MSCVIGFDGFTDEICSVVAQRADATHFTPFQTISEFAQRVAASAHVSGNFELVVQRRKLGGNAPILAQALIDLGHRPAFIGSIGENEVEPLFQRMAAGCQELFSLAASGHTDALEFSDGKLLFGKLTPLSQISVDRLIERVGRTQLLTLFEGADLFASVNWTMVLAMNAIWRYLLQEVIPHLSRRPRYLFVDLADPRKRPLQELIEALELLKKWNATHTVVLGLNESELHAVAAAAQVTECDLHAIGVALQQKLEIAQLVIHTKTLALVITAAGITEEPIDLIEHPVITTGVGDHFNAGYCHGLLKGWPLKETLHSAITVARNYLLGKKS